MTGYPDEPNPLDPRTIYEAKSVVAVPATLLIVTGVLALILGIIGLVQLPSMPARMDAAIAKIDADPNIPADQKDAWRDILTNVKEAAEHPAAVAVYIVGIIFAGLVILGGVKLQSLSGPTFPIIGSILAMTPCTVSVCCLLGLPAGIWALIAVNRPVVRAAMAAKRSAPPPNPDDQYMR